MTLRDLVPIIRQHPFFIVEPMPAGEILAELKRCAAKTQASLEELYHAIQLMIRNPRRYTDPFFSLREDWAFISGQCQLQDHARKDRAAANAVVGGGDYNNRIATARSWYNGLEASQQERLRNRISHRIREILCSQPYQADKAHYWQDPLSNRLGQLLLIEHWRYNTDTRYRQWVDDYEQKYLSGE